MHRSIRKRKKETELKFRSCWEGFRSDCGLLFLKCSLKENLSRLMYYWSSLLFTLYLTEKLFSGANLGSDTVLAICDQVPFLKQ